MVAFFIQDILLYIHLFISRLIILPHSSLTTGQILLPMMPKSKQSVSNASIEVHCHTSKRSRCSVERCTVTANCRVNPSEPSLDGGKAGCHYGVHTTQSRAIFEDLDLQAWGGTAHPRTTYVVTRCMKALDGTCAIVNGAILDRVCRFRGRLLPGATRRRVKKTRKATYDVSVR